jgi:hypothetical protein
VVVLRGKGREMVLAPELIPNCKVCKSTNDVQYLYPGCRASRRQTLRANYSYYIIN